MIGYPNAKINLGLQILNKRSDGFHNLESVFIPLKLADILEVIPNYAEDENKSTLYQSGIKLDASPEQNMVMKAYNLLESDFELPSVQIALHKIVPFGSGLGGGSSDAASIVLMLDRLFNLDLSIEKKKYYLEILGSDCPFFLSNSVSFVSGRGEKYEPILLDMKGVYLVIIVPNVKINTGEAFRLINPANSEYSLREKLKNPMEEWKTNIFNDFEKVLFPKYPILQEIKGKLYELGAKYVSLSGSGSSIYGFFNTEFNPQEHFPGLFTWTERFE